MSSCDAKSNIRAKKTLAAYIDGGRLSHAMLVEGQNGALDFAKEIAKAAVCESGDKPCGSCRHCVKAGKEIHPDIIVYQGGDKAKSFHVDTVREIKRQAFIKPNEAAVKVLVLDAVHNMTVQAQNALLKIIEEPPENVHFILTCNNKTQLLQTVQSRVSVFSLDDAAADADGDDEITGHAVLALQYILSGSELEAMAVLSQYEKNRGDFAKLLAILKQKACGELVRTVKDGKDAGKKNRLIKLIDIIDGLDRAVIQNIGGLLMVTMLTARLDEG